MAIAASHIVKVLPRVLSAGSSDLELNGLILSHNELISADTLVLEFSSAAAVGDYFGSNSQEYRAAEIYFTAYDHKLSAPSKLLIARRLAEDSAAYLRGGRVSGSLADLKKISAGGLAISVDGQKQVLSGLDFSQLPSFSQAAELLSTALTGATVSYSSQGFFTITSHSRGPGSEISFAAAVTGAEDLAALLALGEADGGLLSPGREALSPEEQMKAILAKNQNFVSFSTLWEAETEEMLQWAAWANQHYGWLYVAHSEQAALLSADSAHDAAQALKDSGYDHCCLIYGSHDYAAFILGLVASIAWQRTNGTITAAFKSQSGLAARVNDESTAALLESKNCNYFGNFSTRNADFVFLYPGCLAASDYGYIDPYINSIWLNNRLQVALMDGLRGSGRVPYNTRGYTMVAAWLLDPVNEARNNAAIEAGVQLSERQKSELINEAGLDISQELWTQGYYLQVLDPGASARAQRSSPLISLWYTYGGAVQKIEVASSALV